MSTPLDTIPSQAADLLRTRGWTQGTFHDNQGYCLHGAIRACTPQPGDAEIVRALARHQGFTEDWNDDPSRTENEILTALELLDTSDAMLEDLFGPQWEVIVALVRRAAILTDTEIHRLRAKFIAANTDEHAHARKASHTATWIVFRGNARKTANRVVSNSTDEAAWLPLLDAVSALVIRDFIGSYGFTQAHYDLLTAPWARVIGPAHPNDKKDTTP